MLSSTRHLDEDLCIDFLHGLVDLAKRQEILEHVRGCEACEMLLHDRTAEREQILASTPPELRAPGAALSIPLHSRNARPSVRARAFLPLGIGAFAAAAAILVFALRPASERAPELHSLPTITDLTIWRDASERPPDAELLSGLRAYSAGGFDVAIEKLRTPQPGHRVDVMRRVYLASAYAYERRYDDALPVLESIAEEPIPDPWGTETRWTRWVALKHGGRRSAADSLLSLLANDPGELGERARNAATASRR